MYGTDVNTSTWEKGLRIAGAYEAIGGLRAALSALLSVLRVSGWCCRCCGCPGGAAGVRAVLRVSGRRRRGGLGMAASAGPRHPHPRGETRSVRGRWGGQRGGCAQRRRGWLAARREPVWPPPLVPGIPALAGRPGRSGVGGVASAVGAVSVGGVG